jgi:hypothetical protein
VIKNLRVGSSSISFRILLWVSVECVVHSWLFSLLCRPPPGQCAFKPYPLTISCNFDYDFSLLQFQHRTFCFPISSKCNLGPVFCHASAISNEENQKCHVLLDSFALMNVLIGNHYFVQLPNFQMCYCFCLSGSVHHP